MGAAAAVEALGGVVVGCGAGGEDEGGGEVVEEGVVVVEDEDALLVMFMYWDVKSGPEVGLELLYIARKKMRLRDRSCVGRPSQVKPVAVVLPEWERKKRISAVLFG